MKLQQGFVPKNFWSCFEQVLCKTLVSESSLNKYQKFLKLVEFETPLSTHIEVL